MPEVSAHLKSVKGSPKKIKPIVDLVRNNSVNDALNHLSVLPNKWAKIVSKVITSASANAQNNFMMDANRLKIVRATVDQGPVLKRIKYHARGRFGRVTKPLSHITITIDQEDA